MKTKKKFNHNKTPIFIPNQPESKHYWLGISLDTLKELNKQNKIQKELAKRGLK